MPGMHSWLLLHLKKTFDEMYCTDRVQDKYDFHKCRERIWQSSTDIHKIKTLDKLEV